MEPVPVLSKPELNLCFHFKKIKYFLGASTPLMEAAQEGYETLVDYLIKSGAKVTTVANNGDTALDLAAENGHTKICAALMHAGAKLEHRSEGGRTPLMRAARQGHEPTVDYLIKAGADVNLYSENNEHTVLSFACQNGQLSVVQRLIQAGANPNAKLKDGSTMLIEAAKVRFFMIVPKKVLV